MSSAAVIPGLLVLVSGVSEGQYQQLEKLRERVVRSNEGERIAFTEVDSNSLVKSDFHKIQIVKKCISKFEFPNSQRYAQLWVINLVLTPADREQIETCKLDFCFNVTTNKFCYADLMSGAKSQASAIADHCGKLISKARSALSIVRGEIQDRDSRSPLLLPVKNCDCKRLSSVQGELEQVMLSDQSGKFGEQMQDRFDKMLQRMKSKIRIEKRSGETIFVDDIGGRFKSPSKAGPRHGRLRELEDGHKELCLLRANLRHGVPYHNQFHYDFTTAKQENIITRLIASCHSEKHRSPKTRRLNIFPNDFYLVPASER